MNLFDKKNCTTKIHHALSENKKKINQWIEQKLSGITTPIYSSVDIRNSNFKLAPIDVNLFPAGFNN